jgi:Recombinase
MGYRHTAVMPTGRHMGHRPQSIADKARMARANRAAAELAPVIAELRTAGVTSLNSIAAALNERGIPTPAGSGHWHAAQVSRVLKRLAGSAGNQTRWS